MPINYDIETDYLYLQGLEKGVKEGKEQGIERGIGQGIEQGIEQEHQRAEQEKMASAAKMLKAGLSVTQVADFLGLSEQLVEQIKLD